MARNLQTRRERITVAVIGEGNTEWHYFNDLKQTENLTFNLKPSLPKHSDYDSICSKAVELAKDGYDFIFCTIDMDYIKADPAIETSYNKLKVRIQKRFSNILFFENMPCTEIWFLLHYRRTTRVFRTYRDIKSDIQAYLPGYSKSEKYLKKVNIYKVLKSDDKLTIAKESSQWLLGVKSSNVDPFHPYSEMHLLLERLE